MQLAEENIQMDAMLFEQPTRHACAELTFAEFFCCSGQTRWTGSLSGASGSW
jgi:hypothetical protein